MRTSYIPQDTYTALHDVPGEVSWLVGVFSTEDRAQFACDQHWMDESDVRGETYTPLVFKDGEAWERPELRQAGSGSAGKYVIVMGTLDVPTGQG